VTDLLLLGSYDVVIGSTHPLTSARIGKLRLSNREKRLREKRKRHIQAVSSEDGIWS
jgi:hypothetical protein